MSLKYNELCEDIKRMPIPNIKIRESWYKRYKVRELFLAGSTGFSLAFFGYQNRDVIWNKIENGVSSVVRYFDLLEREKQKVEAKEEEIEKMGLVMREQKRDYENETKSLTKKLSEVNKKISEVNKKFYESTQIYVKQKQQESINQQEIQTPAKSLEESLRNLSQQIIQSNKSSLNALDALLFQKKPEYGKPSELEEKIEFEKFAEEVRSIDSPSDSRKDYSVPETKLDPRVIPSFHRFVEPLDVIDLHNGSVAVQLDRESYYYKVDPDNLEKLNNIYHDYEQRFRYALSRKSRYMSYKVLEGIFMEKLKTDLRDVIASCERIENSDLSLTQ